MKRSDKILLGAFLLGIIILIGAQAALYAKYKKGDFVNVADSWQQLMVTIPTKDINYIAVDNAPVNVEAADSTKLQWQRTDKADTSLQYKRVGDTLFISRKKGQEYDGYRYGIFLQLANPVTLLLKSTRLTVQGSDTKYFPDLHVVADSSELDFSGIEKAASRFSRLDIKAGNQSQVDLSNMNVKNLSIQLLSSKLEESAAVIDSLQLSADLESRISLRMINLSKAKINTTHE